MSDPEPKVLERIILGSLGLEPFFLWVGAISHFSALGAVVTPSTIYQNTIILFTCVLNKFRGASSAWRAVNARFVKKFVRKFV